MIVPEVWAQVFDHVQVGAFGEYFGSNQKSTNSAGLGGRLGFAVLPHIRVEGEMSYDFNRVFTEGFSNTNGETLSFANTGVRALHGLVGPKLELGNSMFRPFLELKDGFVSHSFDAKPMSLDTFVSSVENLRAQNWNAVLMPGGGVEGRLGPMGLPLDLGDEMYFNHGAHHNLKVMFGPYFRF